MIQYIGWLGTFFGFLSFALLTLGKIDNKHWCFSGGIFLSSLIFLFTGFLIESYQAISSNLFFIISSGLSLIGIIIRAKWISVRFFYLFSILVFLISSIIYLFLDNTNWLINSIGWIPVFTFPMNFFLYTQSKITELRYYIFNMSSNIIFSVYLFYIDNYSFLALQVLAFFFGLIGLYKLNKKNTIDFSQIFNRI